MLSLLQENLKHEDSFLYLSAIEGLSVIAAEFPDSVIVTLAEQFCRSSLKPDTRLKVGEALVRVARLLGKPSFLVLHLVVKIGKHLNVP